MFYIFFQHLFYELLSASMRARQRAMPSVSEEPIFQNSPSESAPARYAERQRGADF